MTWGKDDADTVRCINDQVQTLLPACPVCGSYSDLCQVTVSLPDGDLVSYLLMCGSIRAAQRMRGQTSTCTFTLPMLPRPRPRS